MKMNGLQLKGNTNEAFTLDEELSFHSFDDEEVELNDTTGIFTTISSGESYYNTVPTCLVESDDGFFRTDSQEESTDAISTTSTVVRKPIFICGDVLVIFIFLCWCSSFCRVSLAFC